MNEAIITVGSVLIIAGIGLALYLNYQEKHNNKGHHSH